MNEPKKNAANNATCRVVKKTMTAKIYKKFLMKMNSEGHTAAMDYLQQFFNIEITEQALAARFAR